jgi:hypothetical protein
MNKTYNIEVIHIIKEKTILIKCKIMNFSFLIIKWKLNNNLRKNNILNLHNYAINKRSCFFKKIIYIILIILNIYEYIYVYNILSFLVFGKKWKW